MSDEYATALMETAADGAFAVLPHGMSLLLIAMDGSGDFRTAHDFDLLVLIDKLRELADKVEQRIILSN